MSDPTHPFADVPLTLAAIRPGDFVVVELARTGQTEEARSVTVTFEPASVAGETSRTPAAAPDEAPEAGG